MSRRFRHGPRKLLLALTCLVAACVQLALDQPLSPMAVRDALVGRQILVSENGEDVYLYLRRDGIATVNGPTAEFGKWRITDAGELCLLWRDRPERCAPVYVTGGSHYRSGATDLSVLGSCFPSPLGFPSGPAPFAGPFAAYPASLGQLVPDTPERLPFTGRTVLTVRFNPKTKERSLDALRWGLVPHWAKDMKGQRRGRRRVVAHHRGHRQGTARAAAPAKISSACNRDETWEAHTRERARPKLPG